MTTKQIQTVIFTLVLAAGIGLVFLILPGQIQAQGRGVGAQATVGTAFTYQGRLMYNGSAVNGTCSLTFKLYDASSGGTQVGSDVTKSSVSVSDGYFSVDLDFGNSAFTGDARWLEITINSCPGGASNVTLSPRVALNPAPYALSLRPGATVQGSDTSGSILRAINTDTTGTGAGLYGESKAPGGAGVSGFNTASDGGIAVYGNNSASTGTPYGVYGVASDAGSATSYGVYGKSNSSAGTGVGGEAPMNGVFGKATASGNAWGVYGWATAASGTTYGVYGRSDSPNGYGVYSEGNAHVEGQLTWKPITSYLSIPAAAFVPQYNYTAQTYNTGSIVRTLSGSENTFNAPVQLPHGSTVISMTVYWRDDYAGGDGTITLYRSTFSIFPVKMAEVTTSGSGGDGNGTDSTVDYDKIDNSQYTYYLTAQLPTDGTYYVGLYGVVIAYTVDRPY